MKRRSAPKRVNQSHISVRGTRLYRPYPDREPCLAKSPSLLDSP
jgi:hypothetical protein